MRDGGETGGTMKFKVAEDVDAPTGFVFERMTEFTQVEDDLRRRGVELQRQGNWARAERGVRWRGAATVRGKQRPIEAELSRLEPDETAVVDSRIGGMDCTYELSFVTLQPEVTRVAATLELKPNTLTARLIIQTLKLARGRVLQRMTASLARQGNQIEADWRRAGQG